jgi:signal transduction histidine kinase
MEVLSTKLRNTPRKRFSLRYSIGTQIGVIIAVVILLLTIPVFFISAWRQEISGTELMLNQANSIGKIVAAGSSDGVTFNDRQLLARATSGVESLPDFEWLMIRSLTGDTLYTTHIQQAPTALQGGGQIMPLDSVRTLLTDDGDVIVAAPIRMLVGNDRIGEVLIGLKPTVLQANIQRTRSLALWGGIAIAALCCCCSVVIAQWLTKPLRNLYDVAENIALGDLKQRAPEVNGLTAQSEPGVLTEAFNAMMTRLEAHDRELRWLNSELTNINDSLERTNTSLEERTKELSKANVQINEQNQKLQELSKEKDEFLGIAAHDLKNPLTGIQGLAELLMSGGADSKIIPTVSATIFKSSQKMFELIKNLLDVNALERGGQQFTPTTFDIAPSVSFSADVYNGRGAEKNITVHFTYPAGKMEVFADRLACEQVLDNIISNAVKYSPHGKNVWVSIEETSNKEIVIAVKDEGPGLSEEDMKKLFGKFARLSARPTGGEHSTGLGLSIVKKMVEAMHGRVWCESELGKGAAFFVALPTSPLQE